VSPDKGVETIGELPAARLEQAAAGLSCGDQSASTLAMASNQ
jgi:hypothetical protein